MTYFDAIQRLGIEDVCLGGCGLNDYRHRGCIFLGVIHFRDRRFTRRGLRRLLMLVARRDRESDPEYMNRRAFAWFHYWDDNRAADTMAALLHVRFPVGYSRVDRLQCLASATREHRHLARTHPAIYAWARRGEA